MLLSRRLNKLVEGIRSRDAETVTSIVRSLEGADLPPAAKSLFEKASEQAHAYGLIDGKSEVVITRKEDADSGRVCGIHYKYPDRTGKRYYEGGRRTQGVLKAGDDRFPLVTIITVVFNNADTLPMCIDSVLSQDYPNTEYIVIDGGSSDGTLEILKDYSDSIDYILSEPDQGIYDAMNKGLSVAQGEYIAFLNADDFYLSRAISDSISHIQDKGLDLSYAGFFYSDGNGVAVVEDEAKPWNPAMFIQGLPGGHETLFAHRSCYERIGGYDTNYRIVADYDWYMRAYTEGLKGAPLQRTILVMNQGGASFDERREKEENLALLRKAFGDLDADTAEFLYSLKYYKNWHGLGRSDAELLEWLEAAAHHSDWLHEALYHTIEQRKGTPAGLKKPAEPKQEDKLRIAIAVTYLKDAAGGAERIAIEAANALSREGHGVTVVCCQGLASEPFYALDRDIPVIDIGVHPYKQQCLEASRSETISFERWGGREFEELGFSPGKSDFKKWNESPHMWRTRVYEGFFNLHDFDVVISHMPSTYPYVLLNRPPDDRAVHIAALHNAPQFKFYSPLYPAENDMERYMRLVALEKADAITVLFDEYIGQLPEKYRGKAFTLPNFTSPKLAREAEARGGASHKARHRIVSVGRLAPQKDHETLLRAFSKVRERHPDWDLKIYGSGPLKDELIQLASSLGLDGRSIFQGDVRDVGKVYAGADIFAFPSRFEGFPLTLLEAMAFGLPIVGFSDCEGVKYLIENEKDGVLVPGDQRVDRMMEGICALIESEELRKRIGNRARRKASEYTVEGYVRGVEELTTRLKPLRQKRKRRLRARKDLKVAMLATYTEGGAGIAMTRLKQGLRDAGVDARTISFSPGDPATHFQARLPKESHVIQERAHRIWRGAESGQTLFSASYPSLPLRQLDFLRYFDVINLHWVPQLLSNEAIAHITRLGPPVVWTLHDMNPFTGGCHYSDGCSGYEAECAQCPQVADGFEGYPKAVLAAKSRNWGNDIVVVTPSRWLADCARRSRVFRDSRIRVIPNGVDTSVFRPRGKNSARKRLGIPEQAKVMLFTCQSHKERRKGFAELVESARYLRDQNANVHVVTFGHTNDDIQNIGLPHTALGHVDSPHTLAQGYSAADVTVLPTLEDNLPNVILESVACGTPVVAFDSGGVGDAVVDGVTGYTVARGDCQALAEAAVRAAAMDWRTVCSEYAERHFALTVQAGAYEELLEELVHEAKANRTSRIAPTFEDMELHVAQLVGGLRLDR